MPTQFHDSFHKRPDVRKRQTTITNAIDGIYLIFTDNFDISTQIALHTLLFIKLMTNIEEFTTNHLGYNSIFV